MAGEEPSHATSGRAIPDVVRSPRPLTPAQASEYWITVRRDWYWLDLGVPWDEAIRRARHDWAVINPNREEAPE